MALLALIQRKRPMVGESNRSSECWDSIVPNFTHSQWLENFRMSEDTYIFLLQQFASCTGSSGHELLTLCSPKEASGSIQHAFNQKTSWARVVVEKAFGRLKGSGRCLRKRNDRYINLAKPMVFTWCALHDLCENHGDTCKNFLDTESTKPDTSGAASDAEDDVGRKRRDAVMQYIVPYCHDIWREVAAVLPTNLFYVLDLIHANKVFFCL